MWSAYHSIEWRDAVVLALLAVFLVLKPDGLFGTRRAIGEHGDPR
jgi:branched-subunit amino acid ABC-type transport system permease component